MKDKRGGFSLAELLVVTAISVFIFAALTGVFILGNRAWTIGNATVDLQQQSRQAMELMTRELSQAAQNTIIITDCAVGECIGKKITFLIPVATTSDVVTGSVYDLNGNLKLGATYQGKGGIDAAITYLADTQHNLKRNVLARSTFTDPISKLFHFFNLTSMAFADICNGDCSLCPSLCHTGYSATIATNVKNLTFIRTGNTIAITLQMEKTTLTNQTVNLTVNSRVALRNIATDTRPVIPTPQSPADFNTYATTGYLVYNKPDTSVIGPGCGNRLCEPEETCISCQPDCNPNYNPCCGNGIQEAGENCITCLDDSIKINPCIWGGACFLATTPILLANGKTLPIEQIKIGDEVRSFDERSHQFATGKVSKVLRHNAERYLIINDYLKVTPEHRFYSNGKWREIGSLKIGDNLTNSRGKPEKISQIERIKQAVEVYNFEVKPYGTYIANGYVVHNAKATCCGNCVCESGETYGSNNTPPACNYDCGVLCNYNGYCDYPRETRSNCSDCFICDNNGNCDFELGETTSNCRHDCPYTCFLATTPILLANGKTLPIEQIKIGDEVRSFDEGSKQFREDKVIKVKRHQAGEYLVVNGHLKVTPNHKVYSNGKWIPIGLLKIGDNLTIDKGATEKISSIKHIKEKVAVYNLEVKRYHTYIASGYVVHNKAKY